MGCNQYNIKEFLSKFWEGETSLEEEKQIHDFFKYNDIPDELKNDAAYFNNIAIVQEENQLDASFDREILSLIENTITKDAAIEKRSIIVPFYRRTLFKVAASILLVLGLGWYLSDSPVQNQTVQLSTQERVEAEKAFQETKDALLLISSKMNFANKHTQKLNKINKVEE